MKHDQIEWAQEFLIQKGYEITATHQMIRSMPWSEVICFPTTQGKIYLKSMAKDFANEAVLLSFLSSIGIKHLVQILGIREDEHCFLMRDAGSPMRDILKIEFNLLVPSQAIKIYADIQLACVIYVDTLLKINMNDWRIKQLVNLYIPLIENLESLMLDGLENSDIKKLRSLKDKFESLCKKLSYFGIPETLEHGDFHDNNILSNDGIIAISDFGDATVSHPFFSMCAYLRSLEENHDIGLEDQRSLILKNVYLKKWSTYQSHEKLLDAFNIAYALRPFVFCLNFIRVTRCSGLEKYPQYKMHLIESMKTLIKSISEYQ